MIGKCIALRNHQPFLVLLHWACLGTFLYFLLSLISSFQLPVRSWRHRMRFISFALAIFCGSLSLLLFEEMKRIRKNQLRLDGKRSGVFDLGDQANLEQFLGYGLFRRWWPRVPKLNGFEWALPEFIVLDKFHNFL
jgi:hypothetical protein